MLRQQQYRYPFGGRPKPLPLAGLFLFDPEVDMKLMGMSLRGLMEEEGHASLWSGMRRVLKGVTPTRRLCKEMLALLPASTLRNDFSAALLGEDREAQVRLEGIGSWEASALGSEINRPANQRTYVLTFIVGIERASVVPADLIRTGCYAEASRHLSNDPVLGKFLWPQAIRVLKECHEPATILAWQTSVAIEVRLSVLAAMNVQHFYQSRGEQEQTFFLLPTPDERRYSPTRQLFQWLMKTMKTRTIGQLEAKLAVNGVSVDRTTLKRWSCGSHQPDAVWARWVATALPSKEKQSQFVNLYQLSRQLYLLGYIAQGCSEKANRHTGLPAAALLAPWPEFPFGYDTFEAWCAARYSIWLAYHQEKLTAAKLREAA